MIKYWYLLLYVDILVVRCGVDAVLLVGVGPRYVLHIVFSHVVRNGSVLVQRMCLYRFLILLLDLLCLDIMGLCRDRFSSWNMNLRIFPWLSWWW